MSKQDRKEGNDINLSPIRKEVPYYPYNVNKTSIEELLQGMTDQLKFIERKLTLEIEHNISSGFHIQYNEIGNIKSYVQSLHEGLA